MKNRCFLTITLLTIVTLAFLPTSFAQDEIPIVHVEDEEEIYDEHGEIIEEEEEFEEDVPQQDFMVNTSEYMVRLIYFLPNDREAQPDIDTTFDASIKTTRKFYADEMARHGFGRKTFRFETDENGDAIVHHVDGNYHDAFYQTGSFGKILDELQGQFDFANNIYVIGVEISDSFENGTVCGIGGDNENGGHVLVPATGGCSDNIALIPHELGHAFGLQHYFFNSADIMSYGAVREDLSSKQLSLCNAEWLSVHPYFNSDKVITRNLNTNIQPLSAEYDVQPPHVFRLRFELNDLDGLHQAQLIASKSAALNDSSQPEFIDCQALNGVSGIAEFATTRILDFVMIQVIDKEGNYTRRFYEVNSTVPNVETDAVFIPDLNLASAIRQALTIQPAQQITTFDMVRLSSLTATNRGIIDITGLEHATRLESLDLSVNQIQDLTPISMLTQLTELRIAANQIRDLTPLSNLTQLEVLVLSANRIRDLTPLLNLTQLTALDLGNPIWPDPGPKQFKPAPGFNEISDISPLTNLTRLRYLFLIGNHVQDISPLTNLTQLEWLDLGFNEIRDITPLKNLKNIINLVLQHNQINDISAIKGLVRIWLLYIDNNPMLDDLTDLEDMTRMRNLQVSNNPNITDIAPLTRLTQLRELEIRGNQISDLTPLADKTQLIYLYLPNNQISDITPLTRLVQLRELNLFNNQISDARPLMGLVNLEVLLIWGNPITDRGPLLTLLQRNPKMKIHHIRGGDPLPVTLSKFKAERTVDGVVIHWITESEQDNAGFNILRSRTQNGEFQQVNAKLIKGAGTTGERSTYTWTDTTAKPNTVYYYQIEDVSYAGVHKTLMTTRLRGLISATGKMITRWAHYKNMQ